jgi:hypothetical protein
MKLYSVAHLTTLLITYRLYSVEYLGDNELERMSKEAVMVWLVLSWRLLGLTEQNHKNPYNSRLRGWDSNLEPPEYKSEALPPQVTCSATSVRVWILLCDALSMRTVRTSNDGIVIELDRIWKEAVVAWWRYSPGSCLEGLRKITKYIVFIRGVPAEVRTKRFPSTSQKRCLLRQSAWWYVPLNLASQCWVQFKFLACLGNLIPPLVLCKFHFRILTCFSNACTWLAARAVACVSLMRYSKRDLLFMSYSCSVTGPEKPSIIYSFVTWGQRSSEAAVWFQTCTRLAVRLIKIQYLLPPSGLDLLAQSSTPFLQKLVGRPIFNFNFNCNFNFNFKI